jgi:hypothetical protein
MEAHKYEDFVYKNIRAQYKIPDSIQDLPTMKEWLKRMRASKFMIRRLEQAYEKAKAHM